MTEITPDTTREQLAAIVVKKLGEHNISAVLVGGAVVSIYTANKYQSDDLDFICPASQDRLIAAMAELRFSAPNKNFVHPNTRLTVEFPGRSVGIGDDEPVTPEGALTVDGITQFMAKYETFLRRL